MSWNVEAPVEWFMRKPVVAIFLILCTLSIHSLRAEDDPATALRGLGGLGSSVTDPSVSHLGGGTGTGGRTVAPTGVGGGSRLPFYISQCMNGRPVGGLPPVGNLGSAGGNDIFQQTCSRCHALPSVQAAINSITNGVTANGVANTKMPPGNPALGQQVLQFLQSQGAR